MKRTAAGVLLVAVYVRVSKKDQHLTQQFRGLMEEAERRGWRIVRVYRERKSSRKERPALGEMLRAAGRREFGAVMVWRLDRLGRSLIELVTNVEFLRGHGVEAVSVKDGALDTSSASARLQLTMLGAVAEYEREIIRERTEDGLERVRRHGSKSGKAIGRPRAKGIEDAVRLWEQFYREDGAGLPWPPPLNGTIHYVKRAARGAAVSPATLRRAILARFKKGG